MNVTRLAGIWLDTSHWGMEQHRLVLLADGRGSYTWRHDVGEPYERLLRYVSFRWAVGGRGAVRLRGQRS